MKLPLPANPEVFFKPSTCLNAPSSPIHLPALAASSADLEVELAVVLGADAKDVSATTAMQYVLGYMTANDVTARAVQGRGSQWGYCKGFDGFAPVGPVLVSRRVLLDPSVLELRSTLNGRVMQDGRARNMIFSVAEIIAYLSVVSACSLWSSWAGGMLTRRLGYDAEERDHHIDGDAQRDWT